MVNTNLGHTCFSLFGSPKLLDKESITSVLSTVHKATLYKEKFVILTLFRSDFLIQQKSRRQR